MDLTWQYGMTPKLSVEEIYAFFGGFSQYVGNQIISGDDASNAVCEEMNKCF